MCGISGIFSLSGRLLDQVLLQQMTDIINHRGPDDEGYVLIDTAAKTSLPLAGADTVAELKAVLPAIPQKVRVDLALGFRRLAILDLTAKGHQPMGSADGRLWIVYNGEIYNYRELRSELEQSGHVFCTQTDTEVILAAYRQWGTDCQSRFNGMWAFALYDMDARILFCSRDRYGIKPFYYTFNKDFFRFGSEIKQLLIQLRDRALNLPMLWRSQKINALLAYGDETYFHSVKALKPGHHLILKDGRLTTHCYDEWDTSSFESSKLSFPEAVEHYRQLFLDSVSLQMRSNVEVGSCLSGGMDSSAIVCAAAGLTERAFQTFSSFYVEDKALDERQWIGLVAEQTGAVSHLVSPVCNKAVDWFEQATWHNDLPVGAGFVSQFAVMQLAKEQGIKVLLDGQGSDELTAGYKHASYRYFADLLRQGRFAELGSGLADYLGDKPLETAFSTLPKILLSALLKEQQLYRLEFRHYRFEPFNKEFQQQAKAQLTHRADLLAEIRNLLTSRLSNFLYNMMHSTSIQTLLHYEDRMAMAHSVESRVPFLDYRLVDFAFSLPSSFKVKPPLGKYIHREAMRELIPPAIYQRRDKAIFSTPFYSVWLRDKLSGYVQDLFASASFRQRGIYNLQLIDRKWQDFLEGSQEDGEMLFNLIALEHWFRVFHP